MPDSGVEDLAKKWGMTTEAAQAYVDKVSGQNKLQQLRVQRQRYYNDLVQRKAAGKKLAPGDEEYLKRVGTAYAKMNAPKPVGQGLGPVQPGYVTNPSGVVELMPKYIPKPAPVQRSTQRPEVRNPYGTPGFGRPELGGPANPYPQEGGLPPIVERAISWPAWTPGPSLKERAFDTGTDYLGELLGLKQRR